MLIDNIKGLVHGIRTGHTCLFTNFILQQHSMCSFVRPDNSDNVNLSTQSSVNIYEGAISYILGDSNSVCPVHCNDLPVMS